MHLFKTCKKNVTTNPDLVRLETPVCRQLSREWGNEIRGQKMLAELGSSYRPDNTVAY